MRWTVFLTSVVSGASLATSALGAGPFGSIHVGNWNGGAYTNDKTGAFSHCAATTGYANGTGVVISQIAVGNWTIGFGNPAFKLTPGETFPIDLTFDGQAQFHLFGSAVTAQIVVAVLPGPAAVEQLRKAHLMAAVAKGATYQFNLDSTGKLMPVISNCVAKIKASGMASAGDFSNLPAPPKTAAKPVVQSAAEPTTKPAKAPKTIEMNGTGFVISTDGYVLTNYHVIGNCESDIHGNLYQPKCDDFTGCLKGRNQ
jgi:hypothetical protein